MGARLSARIKAETPYHTGVNSRYVGADGNDLSRTSGKVSSGSVLEKFDKGGYLPLAFAMVLMTVMYIWNYVCQIKYYYELDHKMSPDKGENEVIAGEGAGIGKRILIDYAYNIMKRNLRQTEKVFEIPHKRMLKVGMTYEL